MDGSPLPAGAVYEDYGDGTGNYIFSWIPDYTQAGDHEIPATQRVQISITHDFRQVIVRGLRKLSGKLYGITGAREPFIASCSR